MKGILLGCLALSACLSQAGAQGVKPDACSAPEYRQFDFWVGSWRVENAQGKVAGRNEILSVHGGCAIEERWRGSGGMTGSSLNGYDAKSGLWHQTWVDSSGTRLELKGSFDGKSMILSGSRGSGSGAILDRITWTPRSDGTVRQFWESSSDGSSWKVVFDGIYLREGTR